jgi:hypothetical protein
MVTLQRWRNEARDFLEMVLVPGIAAVLPWPLCFRLFRWLCRFDFLYVEECRQALAHAGERGWVRGDPAQWLLTCRLVMLIDNADYFLSRTRSDRWMARHLLTDGRWPEPGQPAILCTFHWGAGMWALRSMGSAALTAHALVAPHVRANFPGRSVRYHYYGARNRENERALGTKSIEASSPRRLMRALNANEQVAVAADVPSDQAAANEPISIIGLHARVPRALFRIAAQTQVPMYVYLTGIRMTDGRRTLKIQPLRRGDDARTMIVEAFELLEQAITHDPAAWHFWKVAPRFFSEPESP